MELELQLTLGVLLQEANRLLPGKAEILSLCSKAWSDVTYLDEIHNVSYKESLSDEQKREVNTKAIGYCEQVPHTYIGTAVSFDPGDKGYVSCGL